VYAWKICYTIIAPNGRKFQYYIEKEIMVKAHKRTILTSLVLLLLSFTTIMQSGCSPASQNGSGSATTASTNGVSQNNAQQANIIFYNGVVLTMENGMTASAIAIQGEYILGVGSDDYMLQLSGPQTALVDLQGRTLMPGFVDPHSHVFNQWAGDPEGAQSDILSKGITTYAEMSAPESVMDDIVALNAAGKLRLRVSLYPAYVDNCGNLLGLWFLDKYPASRQPGAMLQVPGVKMFEDGGSCNVPATSFHYVGRDDYGDLYYSVEELTSMILDAQDHGYQVAIHALGDRAIATTQQAIIAALNGGPNTYRHRIEHNALLPDELLTAYSEYDIPALIFGAFPTCFFIGDTSQYKYMTPPEYAEWEWRWRPLIDSNPGAHIAWHADSPPMGAEDPMLSLFGFVTRQQRREDGTFCDPPAWAANDLLTVEEALPMMTIEGAYVLGRDDEIGSLKAGKLADMIILSDDPLEVDPHDILNIQTLMTMVGGKVEYCAQGSEVFCPSPTPQGGVESQAPADSSQVVQVKFDCDTGKGSPISVGGQDYIQTYINWAATTAGQVTDFLAAVSVTMYLDGQQIESAMSSAAVNKQEDSGLFVSQTNFYVGVLTPGTHTIRTVLAFSKAISDGTYSFGPATENPKVEGTCTVIVK
jgi:predicted amidohydrolase YtcJ